MSSRPAVSERSSMALLVGYLLLWVCGFHRVVCPDYEDDDPPAVETIIHFPEVKDGKCFFPFHYKNGIFYDCVKLKTKHRWCSVNETYQGYWKYCSEDDFAKCVFPFWYRHMIYRECTEDGDAFGKKWCSLTQNYNKDKIWKYCD